MSSIQLLSFRLGDRIRSFRRLGCARKAVHSFQWLAAAAILFASVGNQAQAQTVVPPYDASYTVTDLGSVPGVPVRYGGLTFKLGDPNTLLIGGNANGSLGKLYSIAVTRGVNGHVTGFTGTASDFAAAAYNDGGVAYGPGSILFLARWPVNEMGQTKPGSTITDKIIDLAPLGVSPSPGGLTFVPNDFPGAGKMKLVSWSGGQWYTINIAPDGTGTYNATSAILQTTIGGGPEGIFYVPLGSPLFGVPSLLVSEYSSSAIGSYEVNANGDPIIATRKDFITGLSGAEGAVVDPVTGDFLFSTFGVSNRVIVVKGFVPPPPPRKGKGQVTSE